MAFCVLISNPNTKKLFPTMLEEAGDSDQSNEASLEQNQMPKKRRYERSTSSVEAGGRLVKDVPSNFTLTLKTFLSQLEKDHSKVVRLEKAVSKGKFDWGHEARILLAAGFAEIPQASRYAVEQMVPCVIAALLTEAGIDFDPEKLATSLPSAATLDTIIKEAAADCLLVKQEAISKCKTVCLACDKGNRSGIDHFIKVLSYFDFSLDKVDTVILDIGGTESSSKGAAKAIQHTLQTKIPDYTAGLSVGTSDSGGGGVLDSLRESLSALGLLNDDFYFVIACTLHALQIGLTNAMNEIMGEGGLGKRTLLQLLHSLFDLQCCYPGS